MLGDRDYLHRPGRRGEYVQLHRWSAPFDNSNLLSGLILRPYYLEHLARLSLRFFVGQTRRARRSARGAAGYAAAPDSGSEFLRMNINRGRAVPARCDMVG